MANPALLQRQVKRELLTRLKADAALTALVPDASVDPDGEPQWPFILVASPRTSRLRLSCVLGATVRFDVHAFAGPRMVAGAEVETGEDHVARIGAAIEALFAENNLTLPDGATCRTTFSDAQTLPDGEPDHWHWFAQLNCRVLAE